MSISGGLQGVAEHVAIVVKKKSWWVEEAACVPFIDAAVLIERLVVLAKRDSKQVGVRHVSCGLLEVIRFAKGRVCSS